MFEIPISGNLLGDLSSYRPTINHFVLQALAMALTSFIIPGLKVTSIFGPLATVVALAGINTTLWDAKLFFSVPLTMTESALSIVVANGAMFWLVVKLLPGIEVKGILPVLVAPILFSVINMAALRYGRGVDFIALGQQGISVVESYRQSFLENSGQQSSKLPGNSR